MLVPTIGIEVHVELKSKAKSFSSGKNDFHQDSNTNVTLVDLGYPGSLPQINQGVVESALKAALALHCTIHKTMHFDRKNYFYPDLPKGYQITQKDTPIGYNGYVEIEINGQVKKIGIERIHIEEDTCKSIHESDHTTLNFNRAGVPLIEIVSKPEIANEEEAVLYLEALRQTLLYLGISDVKIEEGSMRCDANISMHEENEPFGTKIEIKNIGSIRHVATSLAYEKERQTAFLKEGKTLQEETRRFDEKSGTTILMRVKETGNDYRYFPEPDLPYVTLSDEKIEHVKQNLPKLPNELRKLFREYNLNENNQKTLLQNYDLCMFFTKIFSKVDPNIAANLLTGEVLKYCNQKSLSFLELSLSDKEFILICQYLKEKKLSSNQIKELLPVLFETKKSVDELIESLGMNQIQDTASLQAMIDQVLDENPSSIEDFKQGKDKALKYLMGQLMKQSKGKANPQILNEMLLASLNKR